MIVIKLSPVTEHLKLPRSENDKTTRLAWLKTGLYLFRCVILLSTRRQVVNFKTQRRIR